MNNFDTIVNRGNVKVLVDEAPSAYIRLTNLL